MPCSSDLPFPVDAHGRRSSLLAAVVGVDHGFTGRGPEARPLHLARRPAHPGVTDAVLGENWRSAVAPHAVAGLSVLNQVHGADVLIDPIPAGPASVVGQGDALVATQLGRVVAVRVADCVPVLLAAVRDGHAAGVAAIHSGWRGTVAGVVPRAVDALARTTGVSSADMVAAIGPCICGEHYEVGPEVVDGLRRAGVPEQAFVVGRSPRDRPLVDVAAAVAHQLAEAGVPSVERLAGCTWSDPGLWSHRRDGHAGGRQAAWIVRSA